MKPQTQLTLQESMKAHFLVNTNFNVSTDIGLTLTDADRPFSIWQTFVCDLQLTLNYSFLFLTTTLSIKITYT